MLGKCQKCSGDHQTKYCEEGLKAVPEKGKVYVLKSEVNGKLSYDVVMPVFDKKGNHREWMSLVSHTTRVAWLDDPYIELPEGPWVGIILEPL